jgi:hypothetical protein
MVVARSFEPPDLVTATLTGVVTARDQAEVVSYVRAAIAMVGTVRILVVLEQVASWLPDAAFDCDMLWLRDDEGVTRAAIVGEPAWRVPVLTLLAQPVRRLPIKYFETEDAARRWLGRGVPSVPTV